MTRTYTIYHNTKCENCGADLTQDHSISVTFSDGERVVAIEPSHVTDNGKLEDIYGLVTNGHHSGSSCRSCKVLLDELDEPEICDECGATYPPDADDLFGTFHAHSCSLHPKNAVNTGQRPQYEIYKYLDIGTGHITQQDDILLAQDSDWYTDDNVPGPGGVSRVSACKKAFGYFVYVQDDNELRAEERPGLLDRGYSEAFCNLLDLAHKLGCLWLLLDSDGAQYPDLPTFEW